MPIVVTSVLFFPMRVSERFSMSQIPTCFATCKEVSKASPEPYKNCMKNCYSDCRSDNNNISPIANNTNIFTIIKILYMLAYDHN